MLEECSTPPHTPFGYALDHKLQPFRLKVEEHTVQDIDKCLAEFNSKSFDLSIDNLRTLLSGMIASDRLVQDFETTYEDGEASVTEFFKGRMFSAERSFDDTIHKILRHALDKHLQ